MVLAKCSFRRHTLSSEFWLSTTHISYNYLSWEFGFRLISQQHSAADRMFGVIRTTSYVHLQFWTVLFYNAINTFKTKVLKSFILLNVTCCQSWKKSSKFKSSAFKLDEFLSCWSAFKLDEFLSRFKTLLITVILIN